MKDKMFPLQKILYGEKSEIPWEYAEEAYKEYASMYGNEQSLKRLGERGGFGVTEIILLLYKRIQRLGDKRDE